MLIFFSQISLGLKQFIENSPSIQYFQLGEGSDLNDSDLEIIAQGWSFLQTLRLFCCFNITETGWLFVKKYCKALREIEIAGSIPKEDEDFYLQYSFFIDISSLRKVTYDERPMYRYDFYNIKNYIKRHRFPLESLGQLKGVVDEYTLSETDDEDD